MPKQQHTGQTSADRMSEFRAKNDLVRRVALELELDGLGWVCALLVSRVGMAAKKVGLQQREPRLLASALRIVAIREHLTAPEERAEQLRRASRFFADEAERLEQNPAGGDHV